MHAHLELSDIFIEEDMKVFITDKFEFIDINI